VSGLGRPRPAAGPNPEMDETARQAGETGQGSDEPDTVPGERGIPSVNRARSLQSRMSSILAVGLMSALGLGLLTFYYAGAITRQSRAQLSAQNASKSRAQGEMALPSLGHIGAPALRATPQSPDDANTIAQRVLGPPPPLPVEPEPAAWNRPDAQGASTYSGVSSVGGVQKSPGDLAFERRLAGVVFAKDGGDPTGRPTSYPPHASSLVAGGSPEGELIAQTPGERTGAAGDRGELATLLQPSVTPAVRAQLLPTRRLLLSKGAFIDCTLETAIDSTLPGMTTCITATDTFGVDGKVVLLERGTKLVGETRGQVQQGSARVFVLWTEARTPTGVVVPLASPGTDELGRAGLAGQVNRHFWDRFGAAILVSVINGAVQAAMQSNTAGGTLILNPSASQDVMTEVLKSTVAIPPTVTKQQGDRIQVLVARDLDFRSVYELRTVATASPATGVHP
jgi:type IV secretion system protein VirB10